MNYLSKILWKNLTIRPIFSSKKTKSMIIGYTFGIHTKTIGYSILFHCYLFPSSDIETGHNQSETTIFKSKRIEQDYFYFPSPYSQDLANHIQKEHFNKRKHWNCNDAFIEKSFDFSMNQA